jgi:hypothetical protein
MTYATLKARKRFVTWLKTKAQARHTFMYGLLEDLVAKALGGKPWDEKRKRSR